MATRQDRKMYDFNSVGVTSTYVKSQRITKEPLPIGIKTPLQLGDGDHLFKMHTVLLDQINDNLRNLVLTNHGERLGLYDFGANLQDLVFELGSQEGDQEAMGRIKRACSKYLPYITLDGFASEVDYFNNKEVAKVVLYVTFSISRINSGQKGLKITLYTAG
jgi:phage baseplate assembly protein W